VAPLLFVFLPYSVHAALLEDVFGLPVTVKDATGNAHEQTVIVTVFRDDARAKAPFLILNHGRAGDPGGRAALGRARYSDNAAWFVERGFVVFVPTRIGYGVTGGPDLENAGPCNNRDNSNAFRIAADQNVTLIEYVKTLPYVDAERGLLAGQSVGGATTLALAARSIQGVQGAINFAGGGGGNPTQRPGNPCSPDALGETFARYGANTSVPMLWLYSSNDQFWGREHPQKWFEQYIATSANGSKAKFVQLPAYGRDGHSSFTGNPRAWQPSVLEFLKAAGF
jgi:dienelactone hydrolase